MTSRGWTSETITACVGRGRALRPACELELAALARSEKLRESEGKDEGDKEDQVTNS